MKNFLSVTKCILALSVLCTTLVTHADISMEPGLWKIENKASLEIVGTEIDITEQILSSKKLIQEQLEKAMVGAGEEEKSMLKDAIGAIDQANKTQTHCLTKQEIQQGLLFEPEGMQGCKIKKNTQSGNQWNIVMDCSAQGHQANVAVNVTMKDTKHYSMKTNILSMGQKISTEHIGTFVSATCPSAK